MPLCAKLGRDTGERRTGVGGARGLATARIRPEGRPRGSFALKRRARIGDTLNLRHSAGWLRGHYLLR